MLNKQKKGGVLCAIPLSNRACGQFVFTDSENRVLNP